jgi:hypothetical protein
MYKGNLVAGLQDTVSKVVPIRPEPQSMPLVWSADIAHDGYGWNRNSHCLARIYSDGQRAVVVLTELEKNPGTSVTNCYSRIATRMREAVSNFIPSSHFPSRVTWLEQYQERPDEIDLVTMLWDEANLGRGKEQLTKPTWYRLNESSAVKYGVAWRDLCRVPEL